MPPQHEPEELFARFLADGSNDSLDALFLLATPPLLRLARRLGHCEADAEDLVQETMVTAIERAADFESNRLLMPWLKGILARKAAQLARSRQRQRDRLVEFARDEDRIGGAAGYRSPAAALIDEELLAVVQRSLTGLAAHVTQPLELYLLEGMDPVEIAVHLGRSRSTVRTQLQRGLQQLRAALPAGVSLAALVTTARAAARTRPDVATTPLTTLPSPVALPRVFSGSVRIGLAAVAVVVLGLVVWTGASALWTGPVSPALVSHTLETLPGDSAAASTPAATIGRRTPVLHPPSLRVRVCDATGRGLPHVGVVVEPLAGIDPVVFRRRAVTDAVGSTLFEGLAPRRYSVRIDRRQRAGVDLSNGDVDHRFEVGTGQEVHGRVVDAAAVPIAGAVVWLSADPRSPWQGGAVCRCDGAGRFVLEAVQPDSLLAAWSPDHARSRYQPLAAARPAAEFTIRLDGAAGCLQGQVRDAEGVPLAGVKVIAGRSPEIAEFQLADRVLLHQAPPMQVRSDAEGRFTVSGLAPGLHPVVALSPGFAPTGVFVQVARDPGAGLQLRLEACRPVSGQVRDVDGVAVQGAQVMLRGADRHSHFHVSSDREGAFRFDCVRPGRVLVAARQPGFIAVQRNLGEVDSAVELQLRRLHRIPGRVVDGAGEPLAGVAVRIRYPRPMSRAGDRSQTVTDAQGRFELPSTTAEPDRISLSLREPGAALWLDRLPDVRWNQPGGAVEVVVDPSMRANARLHGVLRTAEGAPLRRARVYLRRQGGGFFEVGRTGDDGSFQVGSFAAGRYDLFAESVLEAQPSGPYGSCDLVAGATTRGEFHGAATGRVEFDLSLPGGVAPSDAVLTIVGDRWRRRCTRRSSCQGSQVLPVGDYHLYAMGAGFAWINGIPFQVRAGEVSRIKRQLEPAVRRTLDLVGLAALQSADRGRLRVLSAAGNSYGEFDLAMDAPTPLAVFLPVGDYRVELRVRGRDQAPRTLRSEFAIHNLRPRFQGVRCWLR